MAEAQKQQSPGQTPGAEDERAQTPAEKAYILSAIWFRPERGAERYREYLAQASPIASKYGAHRIEGLLPKEVLRGNFDPDYISLIEWPSLDKYYEFLKDMHYRTIAPLREEAVLKSAIIHCRRVG